ALVQAIDSYAIPTGDIDRAAIELSDIDIAGAQGTNVAEQTSRGVVESLRSIRSANRDICHRSDGDMVGPAHLNAVGITTMRDDRDAAGKIDRQRCAGPARERYTVDSQQRL